ncbi:Histidine kinase-, DNA gyrase B-, and HSP90-like ATPase [Dethiosulfatibacter aminovorans DSM 17477]|uniref:histidine kinase n=1 Tax=Dethiosulfatibacter aminovorans DSM 17477 TaxID=1121476 RepID=A0A1M6KJG4_9FIRM|nr:ATP-binding protein [Dethiosulfatibacter aminovorans]SHJ59118.1 Histidine kinase-, DNA gyrase B-, and HSP90-like ATPase [Dethiosulfatibacter aminovorans DSM 17477]
MKELSLHVLDIARNSIRAEATRIGIFIEENLEDNKLVISIEDNGKGMDEETLRKIEDPFYTSRDVRRVGLGIPLLKAAVERCNGSIKIQSEEGIGTSLYCEMDYDHIDRAPLGKIQDTIMILLNDSDNYELVYTHVYNGRRFDFDTVEIKEILDGVPLGSPDVLMWIKGYILENVANIKKSTN